MDETEECDQPLFSSLIKINYDKRFIRMAQNFVENLGLLAGANEKERFHLSLIMEECLSFIMDKYLDCRASAHIQVYCQVHSDKGIRIEITDIGPPIHESMIPSFDITDEVSAAGLWYMLVQKLSDKCEFINRLAAGWLIRVDKKIENLAFRIRDEDARPADALSSTGDEAGEKQIRPANVGDVPALIDLVYLTYRYSYMPDFYDGDLLKKHIEENRYEIMLAEHGSKVIGAYAIKHLNSGRTVAEVGSAMIHPAYRDASAVRLLFKGLNAYVAENPHRCDFFMSGAVTSHIRSQKGLARIHRGFKTLAVFLNMVPRPDYVGIDHKNGGRESGAYVYHLNDKIRAQRLYAASPAHLLMIQELVANTGNALEVLAEFSEPGDAITRLTVERARSLQTATILVDSLGQDWFTRLSKALFAEIVSGADSILVSLPASAPLPAGAEGVLADLNLVFCGLYPRSLDRIDLAYCLTTKPVDFGQIRLFEPVARKLLRHIEQHYLGQG